MFRKLLVLDLDETLIHAVDTTETVLPQRRDFCVGPFAVCERPGVRDFLEAVLQSFEHVGIWTASTADYARPIVARLIDPKRLAFLWDRRRCTRYRNTETYEEVWLKDIRKLRRRGFAKTSILVVDDSPEKLARSYSNLIEIRPYLGAIYDTELKLLLEYLEELGPVDDVRPVEKRGWRDTIAANSACKQLPT